MRVPLLHRRPRAVADRGGSEPRRRAEALLRGAETDVDPSCRHPDAAERRDGVDDGGISSSASSRRSSAGPRSLSVPCRRFAVNHRREVELAVVVREDRLQLREKAGGSRRSLPKPTSPRRRSPRRSRRNRRRRGHSRDTAPRSRARPARRSRPRVPGFPRRRGRRCRVSTPRNHPSVTVRIDSVHRRQPVGQSVVDPVECGVHVGVYEFAAHRVGTEAGTAVGPGVMSIRRHRVPPV